MRNILKKLLGRGSEDQRGFTLIELLVVVGIIVALAAVIVPLVVQFSGRGDEGAAAAEWDAIQSSIDTMMADTSMTTVTAGASAAFITDSIDFDAGVGTQNLATYLRDPSTSFCYTWATTGRILTQVAAAGSPAVCP